eukprot:scaffold25420_cov129-Isochrysis_galbana.AAC.3
MGTVHRPLPMLRPAAAALGPSAPAPPSRPSAHDTNTKTQSSHGTWPRWQWDGNGQGPRPRHVQCVQCACMHAMLRAMLNVHVSCIIHAFPYVFIA